MGRRSAGLAIGIAIAWATLSPSWARVKPSQAGTQAESAEVAMSMAPAPAAAVVNSCFVYVTCVNGVRSSWNSTQVSPPAACVNPTFGDLAACTAYCALFSIPPIIIFPVSCTVGLVV